MSWNTYIKSYQNYLTIEKSLSPNSVDAYIRDIKKLGHFFTNLNKPKTVSTINYEDFQSFLSYLHDQKIKQDPNQE